MEFPVCFFRKELTAKNSISTSAVNHRMISMNRNISNYITNEKKMQIGTRLRFFSSAHKMLMTLSVIVANEIDC